MCDNVPLLFTLAREGIMLISRSSILIVTFFMVAGPVLVSGVPAKAQTQQQIDWCQGNIFTPDLRINGCTAAIQSGRLSGKGLISAFNNRCWAYNDKGESDRALADCNEAIRLDPKYAAADNNRGNAYRAKGDLDRAIADYNEAIRLDPKFALAYNNRGNAYWDKGDLDRAIADYNAIRLDSKYALAYNNRGIAYRAKGDLDHAIADYNEAIRIDPHDTLAQQNRELAYQAAGRKTGAAVSSSALAQTSLLSQFVGIWSENANGCRFLQNKQIDRMSTAEASRFGVIEISNKGIVWLYNSGTTECEFQSQSEAKIVERRVRVPAVCNYKGEETKESIFLGNITSSKLELQFEHGFWHGGKKVRVFKC
jgi:tetratricopeptide (TPR) repeat protein